MTIRLMLTKGRGKNSLSNKAPVFCSASRRAGGRIVTLCDRRLNAEAGQKNKHYWIKYFFHVPKRSCFISTMFAMVLVGCSQLPTSDQAAASKQINPYLKSIPAIPSTAHSAFISAIASIKKGKLNAAKETLLLLKANHPSLSGVYLNLGLIAKRQGQLDEAKQLFLETTKVNALNYEAFNQLALLHREAGKFKQAETAYRQGLAIWNANPDIHYNLAILYDLYLNQIESALEHYKLYQTLLDEPDKQVTVWISALERRQSVQ